jgi:thiol-disulfide isomerase/thioredoxin
MFNEWMEEKIPDKWRAAFSLLLIAFGLVGLLWFGCRMMFGGGNVSTFVGKDVSGLQLRDANGGVRTVGALRGKVVLMDFWATWCPPCRMSLPELAALQAAQGSDYAVVPVSVDRGGFSDIQPFFRQNPSLSLFVTVPAKLDHLDKDVGRIEGIPTTLVVDRDGKVIQAWTGFRSGKLEAELKAALKR